MMSYYILTNLQPFEDDSLLDGSSINNDFRPTPNSEIDFSYSVKEIERYDHFSYQFNCSFNIIKGVEMNFTRDDQVFNRTQMYLSIKANSGLEFYTSISVLNMSEFRIGNSQIQLNINMESSEKFENLNLRLFQTSISEEWGTTSNRWRYQIYIQRTTDFR